MTFDIGLVAGVSVTAVVAATSLLDRSVRRRNRVVVSRVKPETRTALIRRSASQETPFVTGNMVLATNL